MMPKLTKSLLPHSDQSLKVMSFKLLEWKILWIVEHEFFKLFKLMSLFIVFLLYLIIYYASWRVPTTASFVSLLLNRATPIKVDFTTNISILKLFVKIRSNLRFFPSIYWQFIYVYIIYYVGTFKTTRIERSYFRRSVKPSFRL